MRFLLIALLFLVAIPVSSAASSAKPSLTLVVTTDNNGNGLPNWGDSVSFQTNVDLALFPELELDCYQTRIVYAVLWSYPYRWLDFSYSLQSQTWSGGAAKCHARLWRPNGPKQITLNTLDFQAGA